MLKLSKKWSYAIKAIIYIAQIWEIIKVSKIAKDQDISESLLRRIIADLEKKDLLITIKGRNGWVKLWKETNKISAYEILDAVWEELWIRNCTKWLFCSNTDNCTTINFYNNLQTWFNSLLKMYTLDKIMK
jgi:Rrf2 family protein